jgi:hypothetical protein
MYNYMIVLFKDKVRKKIINKFVTLKKATNFYENLLKESSQIIFEVKLENGKKVNYELGIVEMSSKQLVPVYITDEMGRNIKVKLENEDVTLFKISPYKKEELIYDLQKKKKINLNQLIKTYLKSDGIKMIYTLNNKVIIQMEDSFSLFSLKSEEESSRLIDTLSNHFFKIKRMDCIFVKDFSNAQRKYLLNLLSSNGIDKKILYRKFTTHPPRRA